MLTRPGISIDPAGRWWFQGNEITNPEILAYFRTQLHRDPDGTYFIHNEYEGRTEKAVLDVVQGFPNFVTRVTRTGAQFQADTASGGVIHALASDFMMCDEVTLVLVSQTGVPHRLARGAMAMLADYLEEEKISGSFQLVVDGQSTNIRRADCAAFFSA
ncbi:MAG: DUF1285 domain-containing protein [Spirochaetia bacterium]|nr:DUF1285 domain-containing protein [Spirochaetia bacterium]